MERYSTVNRGRGGDHGVFVYTVLFIIINSRIGFWAKMVVPKPNDSPNMARLAVVVSGVLHEVGVVVVEEEEERTGVSSSFKS